MIDYFDQLTKLYQELDTFSIQEAIQAIEVSDRIFVCGNGGSASTASHFTC
jgi:phosphoheptose isomerase